MLSVCFQKECCHLAPPTPTEGRPAMSDVPLLSGISGLSFDSPFLSLLLFFLPSPLALSVLSFFLLMVHSPDFFPPENSQIVFVKG